MKSPAPTIAVLLPPAKSAVMKSVGVSPLEVLIDVPRRGWMMSAVPSVSPKSQSATICQPVADLPLAA